MPVRTYFELSTDELPTAELKLLIDAAALYDRDARARVADSPERWEAFSALQDLRDETSVPVVIDFRYGVFVHVPEVDDDPDGELRRREALPGLQKLIERARREDCWLIRLDADGPLHSDC